ncbi:MAG: EAL domain-containing protein [Magnetococcales bacterium]|nr:EAL domain-containing protein [Magnetococcales bacterium]
MHVRLWILIILPLAATLFTFIVPGTPLPAPHQGGQGLATALLLYFSLSLVSWVAYRTAYSGFAWGKGLFLAGQDPRTVLERGVASPPPSREELIRPVVVVASREAGVLVQGREAGLDMARRVFASVQEGVVITDASGSICSANASFQAMTGYEEAEMLGRNMRFLKSGRHDAAFYAELWKSLLSKGQWQGNIWNRRKNGDIYPQWSTINCIRDKDGVIRHFVGVLSDLTDMRESEEQLKYLAHYDPLTELPNRILFKDRLSQSLSQARRTDQLVGVLWLGLDRFRQINGAGSRALGDQVLKAVGARLRNALREGDTVARVGGDEFAVLATNILEVQHLGHVAEKLQQALNQDIRIGDQSLRVHASIGVTIFPLDESDPDTLLKHAETAMGQVKARGGSGSQFFTQQMGEMAMRRWNIEKGLQRALERGEFFLHYQPQYCVATGRLVGVEALVRWRSPQFGLVSPDQFVPLAEESGLIVPLGEWVLREACQQNVRWQEAGYAPIKMAVNVSPRQFLKDGLEEAVENALTDTGLDPRWLELEITESLFLGDQKRVLSVLKRWREKKLHISIDDFGTGYSSLSYLSTYPVQSLKIDRSFIRDVARNAESASIARTILSLAKNLNLYVVAEGVANEDQMSFLRGMGCDKVQGFLFSPPVPAQDILPLLSPMEAFPAHFTECDARSNQYAAAASLN